MKPFGSFRVLLGPNLNLICYLSLQIFGIFKCAFLGKFYNLVTFWHQTTLAAVEKLYKVYVFILNDWKFT